MGLKILILGVTGMLGHMLFKKFNQYDLEVYGTARNFKECKQFFNKNEKERIIDNFYCGEFMEIRSVLCRYKPDIVINCIGLIRQKNLGKDPMFAIPINSLFPHQLSNLCDGCNIKLIHISTDCVFNGSKGNYKEDDPPDSIDMYGKSKSLGELIKKKDLTIRTSIIGPELKNKLGLVEWFLSQKNEIFGFKGAIYTGFSTVEFARIIVEYVIPNDLTGLYHISSEKISKFDLLNLVKEKFNKDIKIKPAVSFSKNMSLNSEKFRAITGYNPPSWPSMIDSMYNEWTGNV